MRPYFPLYRTYLRRRFVTGWREQLLIFAILFVSASLLLWPIVFNDSQFPDPAEWESEVIEGMSILCGVCFLLSLLSMYLTYTILFARRRSEIAILARLGIPRRVLSHLLSLEWGAALLAALPLAAAFVHLCVWGLCAGYIESEYYHFSVYHFSFVTTLAGAALTAAAALLASALVRARHFAKKEPALLREKKSKASRGARRFLRRPRRAVSVLSTAELFRARSLSRPAVLTTVLFTALITLVFQYTYAYRHPSADGIYRADYRINAFYEVYRADPDGVTAQLQEIGDLPGVLRVEIQPMGEPPQWVRALVYADPAADYEALDATLTALFPEDRYDHENIRRIRYEQEENEKVTVRIVAGMTAVLAVMGIMLTELYLTVFEMEKHSWSASLYRLGAPRRLLLRAAFLSAAIRGGASAAAGIGAGLGLSAAMFSPGQIPLIVDGFAVFVYFVFTAGVIVLHAAPAILFLWWDARQEQAVHKVNQEESA